MPRPFSGSGDGGAHLGLLADDDGGGQVVDDERQLLLGAPPVRRAEERPHPGAGHQQLLDAEGVLPEPEDPVAPAHAVGGQPGRDPSGAVVELGPGQADVAVGDSSPVRAGSGVLSDEVGDGEPLRERHCSILSHATITAAA